MVADLVPRAFWSPEADAAIALPEVVVPAHVRERRWVCPAPGAVDHWETVATGDPWGYLETEGEGLWVGLQVEGPVAVARLEGLLAAANRDRLRRAVDAAARIGGESTTAAVKVRYPPHGRFSEQVLLGRVVETDQSGPGVFQGVIEAAGTVRLRRPGTVTGVRFCRIRVEDVEREALRRAVRRMVRLWQAVWRLPEARGPTPTKEVLDQRLRRLYRDSLRLLMQEDPRSAGRVRAEARRLARAYRDAARARPKLLDQILDRLGMVE